MSSFVLKVVACITMFLDHISYVIYGKLSWLNCIGRIAFPIFAFQISEGYIHTKDLKKYFVRLLIFAFVSEIPFQLFRLNFTTAFSLNIFFTLFLGLLAIFLYDKIKYKFIGLLLAGVLAYVGEFLKVDYGYWGVLIVFFFYVFKDNKLLTAFAFATLVFTKYLPRLVSSNFNVMTLFLFIFTLLPIILILLYNQKQGKKAKYFFYLFYPVHFSLFWLFTFLI